jgi:hypothetical protein
MTSTLKSATLTVRISEEITLNGTVKGSKTKQEISSINEIAERIVTTLTTGTTVLNLGTAAGPGSFIRNNVKYIRITNLDDTNYVRLALITDAGGTPAAHIKIPAQDSFILSTGLAAAEADSDAVTLDNITSIKAWANTASIDLDLFVAST